MEKLDKFYGHVEYIRPFGIFFPVYVYFVKENLATLEWRTFVRGQCSKNNEPDPCALVSKEAKSWKILF
jgi:hypothetical protein